MLTKISKGLKIMIFRSFKFIFIYFYILFQYSATRKVSYNQKGVR